MCSLLMYGPRQNGQNSECRETLNRETLMFTPKAYFAPGNEGAGAGVQASAEKDSTPPQGRDVDILPAVFSAIGSIDFGRQASGPRAQRTRRRASTYRTYSMLFGYKWHNTYRICYGLLSDGPDMTANATRRGRRLADLRPSVCHLVGRRTFRDGHETTLSPVPARNAKTFVSGRCIGRGS